MRRQSRPWIIGVLATALAIGSLVALPPRAAVAASTTVLDGFEGPSSQWSRVAGAPTVSSAASLTEGSASFSMAYDLSAGSAEVQRSVTDSPVVTAPSTALTVDLKGDGTYNTAYLKLRDATGELFMYRLDAMRSSNSYPVTIDLRKPAASSSGGNADGVLDAPFVFSRVLVVRNGSQPAKGTITLDNLRETPSGWSLPTAAASYFAPAKGESTTVSFEAGGGGDYAVILRDGGGRERTLTGSTEGGAVAIPWDGRDNGGIPMSGVVKAVFQHDASPDGTLDTLRTNTGISVLTTLADADPAFGVTTVVEGFESGTTGWSTSSGGAALSVSSEKTEGESALKLDYDLRSGGGEILRTPGQRVADSPVTAVKVDMKGDASYNTVYVKIRDASGEDFTYRLDAMRSTTWSTTTADLTKAAPGSSGGNGDGILDVPLTLRGFSVIRNGSQPATGSVVLDNVRAITTGWSKPTAATTFFTPQSAGTLPLTFEAATSGDFSLELRTNDGLVRMLAGTADSAGTQKVEWDGRSDDGRAMTGDVSGIFRHDSTPDGTVGSSGSTQSGLPFVVTVASTSADSSLVESFDTNDDRWLSTGTGEISTSTSSDTTEGTGALTLDYDVSAGNASIETRRTPPVIATAPLSGLLMDLKGDSSYNSVYVVLEDATGENFMYLTDALRLSRWTTTTVDLNRPPAISRHGNQDGVLDYPLSLLGISIARNGTSAPASGAVSIDNLRLTSQAWSLPVAFTARFSSASGQSTSVTFNAGTPGDYTLTLADLSGRTRTYAGSADESGPVTIDFDGKDGSGVAMAGSIKAQLRYDTSSDGSLSSSPTTASNPYATGVTARPSEPDPRSIAGVNAFLTSLDDPAKADRQAALMEEAFLRDDREEFEWKRVEPRKGFFDWAKFDQAVAITGSRNIQMIGKLGYSAPWASSAPAGTPASSIEYYPPTNISDFTDYVSAVVDRYKDRVHVWEVWNEPNTATYWKPGPGGAAYGQLLKATYQAIKAIDPSATVLIGGTAGFDRSFMKGIESVGAGNSYDGLAIHSYSKGSPKSGQAETWLDAAASYLERRSPARSLWITEVGWPTCTQCDGATSEADQANYLAQTYLDASARGVAGVTWYNLVGGANPQARLDTFALTTKDGRKKPSYDVLKSIGAAFYQAESSGPAAVTASDSSIRVNDMNSTSGFTSAGIAGGSAKLSVTTSRHSGVGGFRLDYNYGSTSKGGQISTNQHLPGEPTAVSVWVYGDGSMNPIYLKLVDSTGERFQALVGNAGASGWKKMTLFSDGMNGNYTHAGGNGDGKWNYPVTLTDVFAYKGTAGVTSGSLFLDDITVDYGVNVHGTVLLDRSGTTQAVYTAEAANTQLRVTGDEAFTVDGDNRTAVPIESGKAAVSLGQLPVFVESKIAATPTEPASGTTATISWIGGDRHRMTVQILASSGALIRTITTEKYFDAGRSAVAWDGKKSNGAIAPPGTYTAKVTLTPVEGALIFTSTSFTIAPSR